MYYQGMCVMTTTYVVACTCLEISVPYIHMLERGSLIGGSRKRIKEAEQENPHTESKPVQILKSAVTIDYKWRYEIEKSKANVESVHHPQRHEGQVGEEEFGTIIRQEVEGGVDPPEQEELQLLRLPGEAEMRERKDGQLD